MRKQFLILFAAASVLFTSCEKDPVGPGNNPGTENPGGGGNPPPASNTKLLKKVTEVDADGTQVFTFTYDGNKRLTSFKNADNSKRTNITYDGAGNVTKVDSKMEDTHMVMSFTYNNGIPVTGSLKSYEITEEGEELVQDDELTYTVENNKVTKIHVKMKMAENFETEVLLSYNNAGEVTKIESGTEGIYAATFTYGTKKSPFPKSFKYILDYGGASLQFFAKSDLQTQSYSFAQTNLDYTITNQYTYDAAGYPLTSTDGESTFTYEY